MNESANKDENTSANVNINTGNANVTEIKPLVAKNVCKHTWPEMIAQLRVEGMILAGKIEDVGPSAIMDAQFELIVQLCAKREELLLKMQRYALDNDNFYSQVLKHNLLVKRDSNGRITLEYAYTGSVPAS